MLEKAKTSATRKDEHGLARMAFEGVDLTPDDAAQMKRIKARVAIEEQHKKILGSRLLNWALYFYFLGSFILGRHRR